VRERLFLGLGLVGTSEYVRGVHESGGIFGLLPPASVAVSTGIGNARGIAVNSVSDFVKVIMVTVGCPRIVLKTEPDPLTIPTPVFRLPRFGLRDHLIYRAEQSFIFRLIQSPSLVPTKTGSAGVYRQMRLESSGGSPTRHDLPVPRPLGRDRKGSPPQGAAGRSPATRRERSPCRWG
jgi:hypothetical protein